MFLTKANTTKIEPMGIMKAYICQHCKSIFGIPKQGLSRLKTVKRSDQKLVFLNRISTPDWFKCPHCEKIIDYHQLILEEQKTNSDEAPFNDLNQIFCFNPLTPKECLYFINSGQLTVEKQISILKFAWHLINNEWEKVSEYQLSQTEIDIMQLLLNFLQKFEDNNNLQIADLLRALARFEEASKELFKVFIFEEGAKAEQLMRAIDLKDRSPFIFTSGYEEDDFAYAWKVRTYRPEVIDESDGEALSPPAFYISNREWWIKILGMLSHNWALIERHKNETVTVFFFQDKDIDSRGEVIDHLDFVSESEAFQKLQKNGFDLLLKCPGPWIGMEPRGPFYDSRSQGKGIYSIEGYWV